MKKIVLSLMVLALAGCKTELKTFVNLSQLSGGEPVTVNADLNVEVAGCSSFEDSRVESRSLQDAKKAVSGIIPKAKYVQCYQKKMNSFASFSIPVVIGNFPGSKNLDPSSFYVFQAPQLGNSLMVALPSEMKKQIQAYKKKSFMTTLGNFDIDIVLKNDTKETFFYAPIAVYVDNFPVVTSLGKGVPLPADKSVTFRLSDVSAASALNEEMIATTVLLVPTSDEQG